MTYCFATDIVPKTGPSTSRVISLFKFMCHLQRSIDTEKHLDNEMLLWIMDNTPDAKFVIRDMTERRHVLDDTTRFSNIHPEIDGLTRLEALEKTQKNLSLKTYHRQMIAQLYSKTKLVLTKRWCVLMSDSAAVHFKLRFPTAKQIKG